jgi:carbon-monoxide dehydrogenase medium subunit
MYAFNFERPTSVKDAVALLAENSEAKVLAGGHSLIPVLKLRLANPGMLIDLSKIAELKGVKVAGETVTIGATTTHSEVANSKELLAAMPALAAVPASIGDPHVRQAGTIGGSVANNDPNADYPAACLGLGATIVTSKRKIEADKFFKGMFDTALEADEIITEIAFPVTKTANYQKFKHPASGFALVGVFVSKGKSGVRVAVTGAGSNGVFRVKSFEDALTKDFSAKAIESIKVPQDGLNTDIHAGADYRAHLIGVLAKRAVMAAAKA